MMRLVVSRPSETCIITRVAKPSSICMVFVATELIYPREF